MIKRITEFMLQTDTRGLRLFLGVLDVLWGIWLLSPLDTFSVSRAYRAMEFWAPEWVWGLAIFLLGMLLLYYMATKHYWSLGALYSLFGNILFWGIIVISILVVAPASTGLIVYFLVFLIAAGLYVKGQVYRHEYPEEA